MFLSDSGAQQQTWLALYCPVGGGWGVGRCTHRTPDRTLPIYVLSQAISNGRHELVGRPQEVSQARDTTCTGREHVRTLTAIS